MECYNCGALLTENDFCTNCGADVKIYKKIIATSNRYYNIGLERAGIRDLSGALESLRQCLKLNKNHADARNLLGLIYYETGEVVSALNEWVMSKNVQPHKNIADDYIEELRSNRSLFENLTQAVKKYNQALGYCKQGSVDLAVIQLKKILSMSPKYLQAHQLLAMIYITQEEWEKAEREVEKALRIDNSNTMTLRYLREIDHAFSMQEGKGYSKRNEQGSLSARKYQSGNDTVIQPINNKDSRGLSVFINIMIGIAIGITAAVFLITPARVQKESSKSDAQIAEYSDLLSQKTADLQERERQIESLKEQVAELKLSLEDYTGTDGTITAYEQLLDAVDVYLEEEPDILAVADRLGSIDESYVEESAPESYRNIYRSIYRMIGPEIAVHYYDIGLEAYNAKNYSEAASYLQMAVSFDASNSRALYFLAESYYRLEDMEHARECYKKIIELFPGYDSAVKAQKRLKEIGEE